MPITFTTRFGFPQWSADTDAFVTRAQFDAFLSTIDAQGAQYAQGLASARPGFGVAGRFYEATDTGVLSYDTGAAWVTIGAVAWGTAADVQPLGPAAVAGGSGHEADAAHVHSGLVGLRAGPTLTGGGSFTRSNDANNMFGWTGGILVTSQGRGADSSTDGYFYINQPAAGTAVAVSGGSAARNWAANGVQLGAAEALWYHLPVGSGNASVPGNFLVTNFSAAMEPPGPDYVLIAVHNGDTDGIVVFVGERLTLAPGGHIDAGEADTSIRTRRHLMQRLDSRQVQLGYAGSQLTSVTEKDSGGATTVKTTTLTYTSGKLTSVAETVAGRTVTSTLAYSGSQLTGVTRAVT